MVEAARAAHGAVAKLRRCVIVENVDFLQEARPLDLRGRGLLSNEQLSNLVEQWGCSLNDEELDKLRQAYGNSVGIYIGKLNRALDLNKVSPDFIVDPSLMCDRLPQPYRMIDKVLHEYIVEPVLDTIDEQERRARLRETEYGGHSVEDAAACPGTRHMADMSGVTCVVSLVTGSSGSCAQATSTSSSYTDQDPSKYHDSGICFAGTSDGHIVIIDDVRAVSEPAIASAGRASAPRIAGLACVRRPSDDTVLVLAALQWKKGRQGSDPPRQSEQQQEGDNATPDSGSRRNSSSSTAESRSVVVMKLFALTTTRGQHLTPVLCSQDFELDQVNNIVFSKDASCFAVTANKGTQVHVLELPLSCLVSESAEGHGGGGSGSGARNKSGVSEVRESDELSADEEDDDGRGGGGGGGMGRRNSDVSQATDPTTVIQLQSRLSLQDASSWFDVQLPVQMKRDRYSAPWKVSQTRLALVLKRGACSLQVYELAKPAASTSTSTSISTSTSAATPMDERDGKVSDNNDGAPDAQHKEPTPVHEWFVHSQITSWSLHAGPPSEQCVVTGTADGSVFVWDLLSGAPRGRGSRRLPCAVTSVRMDGKDTVVAGGANGQVAIFTAPGTSPFGQPPQLNNSCTNDTTTSTIDPSSTGGGARPASLGQQRNKPSTATSETHRKQVEAASNDCKVICSPKDWVWPLLSQGVRVPGVVKQLVVLPGTPLCFVISLGTEEGDRPFVASLSKSAAPPIKDKWMVWACDVGNGSVIGKLEPCVLGGGGDGSVAAPVVSDTWVFGASTGGKAVGDLNVVAGQGDRILVTCSTPTLLHDSNASGSTNDVNGSERRMSNEEEKKEGEVPNETEGNQQQQQEQQARLARQRQIQRQRQKSNRTVHLVAYALGDLAKVLYPSVTRACTADSSDAGGVIGSGDVGGGGGYGGGFAMSNMLVSPMQQLTQRKLRKGGKELKQVLRMTTAAQRNDPLAMLDHLDPSADRLDLELATPMAGNASGGAFGTQSLRSKLSKGLRSVGGRQQQRQGGQSPTYGARDLLAVASQASRHGGQSQAAGRRALSPTASVAAMSMASGMFMSPSKQHVNGPTSVEFRKVQGPVDVRQQAQEFLERRAETHIYREAKLKQSVAQWVAMAEQNGTFTA